MMYKLMSSVTHYTLLTFMWPCIVSVFF